MYTICSLLRLMLLLDKSSLPPSLSSPVCYGYLGSMGEHRPSKSVEAEPRGVPSVPHTRSPQYVLSSVNLGTYSERRWGNRWSSFHHLSSTTRHHQTVANWSFRFPPTHPDIKPSKFFRVLPRNPRRHLSMGAVSVAFLGGFLYIIPTTSRYRIENCALFKVVEVDGYICEALHPTSLSPS